MNRTQELIWRGIENSPLPGTVLLLEALLRRGFLAYRDHDGLWLGTGSHGSDASVLQLIPGLASVRVHRHPYRYAEITLVETDPFPLTDIARAIVALGEHHVGGGWGGFSGFGLGYGYSTDYTWRTYRDMTWGARPPVCPADTLRQSPVQDALDIGTALLVKCLSLVGVVTQLSCDGHGVGPATVDFCFDWDSCWGKAVFSALSIHPAHSEWEWGECLTIRPANGYGDESVTLMLDDIRRCARTFLDNELIGRIARARGETLRTFPRGAAGPTIDDFAEEAARRLGGEFGSAADS
jgi:hypothetical protein